MPIDFLIPTNPGKPSGVDALAITPDDAQSKYRYLHDHLALCLPFVSGGNDVLMIGKQAPPALFPITDPQGWGPYGPRLYPSSGSTGAISPKLRRVADLEIRQGHAFIYKRTPVFNGTNANVNPLLAHAAKWGAVGAQIEMKHDTQNGYPSFLGPWGEDFAADVPDRHRFFTGWMGMSMRWDGTDWRFGLAKQESSSVQANSTFWNERLSINVSVDNDSANFDDNGQNEFGVVALFDAPFEIDELLFLHEDPFSWLQRKSVFTLPFIEEGGAPGVELVGVSARLDLVAGTGALEVSPELTGQSAELDLVGGIGSITTGGDLVGEPARVDLVGGTGDLEALVSITGVEASLYLAGGTGSLSTGGEITGQSASIVLRAGTGEVTTPEALEIVGQSSRMDLLAGVGSITVTVPLAGASGQVWLRAGIGTVGAVYVEGQPLARQITNVPVVRQITDVPLTRQVER